MNMTLTTTAPISINSSTDILKVLGSRAAELQSAKKIAAAGIKRKDGIDLCIATTSNSATYRIDKGNDAMVLLDIIHYLSHHSNRCAELIGKFINILKEEGENGIDIYKVRDHLEAAGNRHQENYQKASRDLAITNESRRLTNTAIISHDEAPIRLDFKTPLSWGLESEAKKAGLTTGTNALNIACDDTTNVVIGRNWQPDKACFAKSINTQVGKVEANAGDIVYHHSFTGIDLFGKPNNSIFNSGWEADVSKGLPGLANGLRMSALRYHNVGVPDKLREIGKILDYPVETADQLTNFLATIKASDLFTYKPKQVLNAEDLSLLAGTSTDELTIRLLNSFVKRLARVAADQFQFKGITQLSQITVSGNFLPSILKNEKIKNAFVSELKAKLSGYGIGIRSELPDPVTFVEAPKAENIAKEALEQLVA